MSRTTGEAAGSAEIALPQIRKLVAQVFGDRLKVRLIAHQVSALISAINRIEALADGRFAGNRLELVHAIGGTVEGGDSNRKCRAVFRPALFDRYLPTGITYRECAIRRCLGIEPEESAIHQTFHLEQAGDCSGSLGIDFNVAGWGD